MKACPINLTADEESSLNSWVRNRKTEQRLAIRARIILAAAKGEKNIDIAKALSIRAETVSKWRVRFSKKRLLGLTDAPRSGKPISYVQDTEGRILRQFKAAPFQWTKRYVFQKSLKISYADLCN